MDGTGTTRSRHPSLAPVRVPAFLTHRAAPAAAAALVWVAGIAVSGALPRALQLDPFTVRGAVVPAAFGVAAAALLLLLWLALRLDVLLGVGAGLVATTLGLALQQGLLGSPFGPGGILGDAGRFSALATRYTVTTSSADAIIPGAPSEYPPLVPWLVGRAAVLFDRPAWTLLGWTATLLTGLSVVVAFWLWNRLVTTPVALALAALAPYVFPSAGKSFHLFALMVLAPWVITSLCGLSRQQGGLHWAVSGALGAVQVLVYPGYLTFAALGILAVVALTWWWRAERTRYVLHLAGIAAVAAVLSAWYVVPFLLGRSRFSTGSVSDRFESLTIAADPGHLPPTVLPDSPLLLVLWGLGAVGLAWYTLRGRTWAWVISALVLGTYAYRIVRLVVFVGTGSTGFLHYANRLIDVLLTAAGVLVAATALRALPRVLRVRSVPRAVPVVLALAVTMLGTLGYLSVNRQPGPGGDPPGSEELLRAQLQRGPDCRLPRFSPGSFDGAPSPPCFPAAQVRRVVQERLGTGALPVALSYSEELWAYYPWYGFMSNGRMGAGLYQNWDARLPVLQRLAGIAEPGALATAMTDTGFGPLDVLVLRRPESTGSDQLLWSGSTPERVTVAFRRAQFAGPQFAVVDLPERTTVVIRLDATVEHAPYPA